VCTPPCATSPVTEHLEVCRMEMAQQRHLSLSAAMAEKSEAEAAVAQFAAQSDSLGHPMPVMAQRDAQVDVPDHDAKRLVATPLAQEMATGPPRWAAPASRQPARSMKSAGV